MQTGIAEPPALDRVPTVIGRAVPADAPAMAALHVRAWRAAYSGMMPDAFLAGLSDRGARGDVAAQRDRARPRARRAGDPGRRGGGRRARASPPPATPAATTSSASVSCTRSTSIRRRGAATPAARCWPPRRLARRALRGLDPVGGREQRARAPLYERAGWSPDGATKIEIYDGASVSNCRYRRAARRSTLHAGVRHPGERSGCELVRHHCVRTSVVDGLGGPPGQRRDVERVDLEHVGVRLAAGAGAEVAVAAEAVAPALP